MASNMEPQNTAELCKSALGGSKTVLGSSWFGPFFVLSFGIAFLVVLGSFWGRFWALCGSVWCFFGISTHRFNPSTQQLVDATHQLINLSTHQPMALRHFLTRPGGLRAARLELISLLINRLIGNEQLQKTRFGTARGLIRNECPVGNA